MDEYGDKNRILSHEYKERYGSEVSNTLKFVLFGFAVFFWVLGAAFCAIGGYVVSQSIDYESLSNFAIGPGVISIILGFFIFVMSTFGLLGILRENIRLLKVYKIFLLCVLVFEVFCGFVAVAFWPEVKKIVDQNVATAIENYDTNKNMASMIDMLQRHLGCCGSLSIDDWDSNSYFSCKLVESYKSCGVPWSCCLASFHPNRQCGFGIRRSRHTVNVAKTIHTIGCMDKAFVFFKENMTIVAAFALACTLPLICEIFMIHAFIKSVLRQMRRYKTMCEEKTAL